MLPSLANQKNSSVRLTQSPRTFLNLQTSPSSEPCAQLVLDQALSSELVMNPSLEELLTFLTQPRKLRPHYPSKLTDLSSLCQPSLSSSESPSSSLGGS